MSWNEFQHNNKGKWTTSGLSEAWHRYESTQVTSAVNTQIQHNYQKGMQFDQYVKQTQLHNFAQQNQVSGPSIDESLLKTQESFNVTGIPQKTMVRPDDSLYSRNGQLSAIADAKNTSYLTSTPQMKGFIQVAQRTSSRAIIIYTPQQSGLKFSNPLMEYARLQGVKLKIIEVP